MLGIRISLEDVTASHGLLPEGKGPPPPIPITQPDAQVPPPPPKVPSILPFTHVAVSHSPCADGSPNDVHDSRTGISLSEPLSLSEPAHTPPSTQLTSVLQVQQTNTYGSEATMLSEDSAHGHTSDVMGSPNPTQSRSPSLTPSSTPEAAVHDALTGIELVPRPPLQIKPYCPKDTGSSASGALHLPLQVQTGVHAVSSPAVDASSRAQDNTQECESPDRSPGGVQESYGEGVSSPVHCWAANASPLLASTVNCESTPKTSRALAASPSVVSATNSGVHQVFHCSISILLCLCQKLPFSFSSNRAR